MVYKGVERGKQGCGLGHAPDLYIAVTIESKSIEKKKKLLMLLRTHPIMGFRRSWHKASCTPLKRALYFSYTPDMQFLDNKP